MKNWIDDTEMEDEGVFPTLLTKLSVIKAPTKSVKVSGGSRGSRAGDWLQEKTTSNFPISEPCFLISQNSGNCQFSHNKSACL